VDAKVSRFLYACGIPFNVLRSPYWHEMVQAINGAPKRYMSPSFTDADWEGCIEDKKSTSGCCFRIGSSVISWFSRKQRSMALSSTKAEYMVASLVACEALWLRKLLLGLFR
jgi:hypothetical protein